MELRDKLQKRDIIVYIVSPGWVSTRLFRNDWLYFVVELTFIAPVVLFSNRNQKHNKQLLFVVSLNHVSNTIRAETAQSKEDLMISVIQKMLEHYEISLKQLLVLLTKYRSTILNINSNDIICRILWNT